MNVEDNLDSDTFYDFWQLSGCDVVLCRNSGHISKITTDFFFDNTYHYKSNRVKLSKQNCLV